MSNNERFKVYVAAYLILKREGKILLLKRANTGYHDGDYSLVAGHLDGGETAEQCIVREALEEANIMLSLEGLEVKYVQHRLAPEREYFDIFVMADKWQGEIKNLEPEKCTELAWFSLTDLPNNFIPEVRLALERIEQGIHYGEFGWQ